MALLPLLLCVLRLLQFSASLPDVLPGCHDRCGNVTIPYPFGMTKGCYHSHVFLIRCEASDRGPPLPYLWGRQVISIVPETSELYLLEGVTQTCHNHSQEAEDTLIQLQLPPYFSISHTKNTFYGVGCGTIAAFLDLDLPGSHLGNLTWDYHWTGMCTSTCDRDPHEFRVRTTCSGFGCCYLSFPEAFRNLTIMVGMLQNSAQWYYDRYPCSYGFIVENNHFRFSPSSLDHLSTVTHFPIVVTWEIGDGSCTCSLHSLCVDTRGPRGAHTCQCLPGYTGNPYHPNGCFDINECKQNPCTVGTCINTPGSYYCSKSNHMRWDLILLGTCAVASLLCLIFIIVWLIRRFRGRKSGEQDRTSCSYTIKQIRDATNNLDVANKIGQGGFGFVYRGILPDGTIVAVKQLTSASRQGNQQFLNEVGLISTLRHPNLVRLCGWCVEENELFLVYEFMENGSLDYYLFGPGDSQLKHNWDARQQICVGVAKGLAFLHQGTPLKVVHGDIKAANILLDREFNAKISDFGLAKLNDGKNPIISRQGAPGTIGYMAPEFVLHGQFNDKIDNYSFGVLALELISGKRLTDSPTDEGLVCWARDLNKKENLLQLVDPSFGENCGKDEVIRAIKIALLCISRSHEQRPAMTEVVKMLQGEVTVPELDMHSDSDAEAPPEVQSIFAGILEEGRMRNELRKLETESTPLQ